MTGEGPSEIHIPMDESMEELKRTDEAAFAAELKALVREAEDMRLGFMRSRQNRYFVAMTISLLVIVAAAVGFGWYFLMEGDLIKALGCVLLGLLPPLFLYAWAEAPIKRYARAHKLKFMPRLARAIGGLQYKPDGGINPKILGKTGLMPSYDSYRSEDCFMGSYKGVKVMFSEARLSKGGQTVFQGLLVVMELPRKIIHGHIILTADRALAQSSAGTRWKKLSATSVTTSNPDWNRFVIFASNPEEVPGIINEKLLKELSEAADIFNRALLSAAIFRERFVFFMIPNEDDMFEASDINVPIPINENAETRRREIEKLLEVMDVFEIYSNPASTSAPAG